MQAWPGLLLLFLFCSIGVPSSAQALDDTQPSLRWGVAVGVSGSLPVGDLRASAATRDEFTPGLWVDIEPLQFDIGAYFNLSPVARFIWRGGVDPEAIEAALDSSRRVDALGKPLDSPKVSALELGLKTRYFPWGDSSRFRPYAVLGLSYSTLGAGYETAAVATGAPGPGGAARTSLRVHRHQGLGSKLGIGLRYDQPIRVFNTEMRVPIALELSYTHHTWFDLDRSPSVETQANKLAGEGPFVDYLTLSLTLGFLR